MFSDKEQAVLDLITTQEKVSIEQIEKILSKSHIGGIGKLIQANLIKKIKIREGQGYNTKTMIYYVLIKGEK